VTRIKKGGGRKMSLIADKMFKAFEPEATIEIRDVGKLKRKLANTILSEIQRFLWDKYSTLIDGENKVIYIKRRRKRE